MSCNLFTGAIIELARDPECTGSDVQAAREHVESCPACRSRLDGERELAFSKRDRIEIRLEEDAFLTVNVGGVMQHAAGQGIMAGPAARLRAAE